MAKRSGLLRIGSRSHLPGDAGGEARAKKIKKKKKTTKIKVRAVSAVKPTTSVFAAASGPADDLFALGLPATSASMDDRFMAPASGKKKRERDASQPPADVERPAAFEDESKQDLMRKILSAASTAAPVELIGPDRHRAHVDDLKRRKADRAARRAERFSQHLKC